MRKKHRPDVSRARVGRLGIGLLATISAFCLLLVMTTAAFANTVNIYDRAGVLDQSRVNSAGSALSYPVDIYTINNFSGSTASFDQMAKGSINNSNKIVIAIDTVHQHLTIVGGRSVSLSDNQYADARNAFATSFRNDKNYTSATVAALQSLQGAASGSGLSVPGASGGGFSWLGGLCCVGLIVVAAIALFGVLSRRRRGGGGGLFGGGGGLFGRRGNYGPNYNQFNQGGYPPNYGPNYPGGYNQNQGMNPWAAGGLGAAAGGLVGYELGKEAGERDERGDQGNFGNDQGGFGGGASGDFGGGNNNGGDQGGFGGGASGDFGGGDNSGGGFGGGGGDFGGGGGGDFGGGGGGGGDFGGGGGGSF